MRRTLGVTVAALLAAGAVSAERYRFRNYGADEGLNTAVTRLLQDRTGFLWVGTGDGLFRYDGARFQRYGKAEGLPSASIRCLNQSPDGTLWVLTGRGLSRLRGSRFEIVDTGASKDNADYHAIDSTRDGTVYLGFDRGLLAGIPSPDGSPPRFMAVPGIPADPVNGVFVEDDDSIWFSSGLRLCLLQHGRLQFFGENDGLPPERWGAMLRDRLGNFWVRGPRHLYMRLAGTRQFVARDSGLPQSSNTMLSMALDRDGALLVSTDQGVARWTASGWQLIDTTKGLESDTVTSVLQDREGSIWIGLWGAGLVHWPGNTEWTNWTTADGLSNNVIWAVRRHPDGSLWVGTDRGLARLKDGDKPRLWFQKDGLGGDKIKALAIGPDGAVWVACLPGGVTRIDPVSGRTRTYDARSGLADDRVISIFIDHENHLWASTPEGLYRSTSLGAALRFERQVPPETRERTMFFRFLGDRRGRMWVGSATGLYCWDHGQWMRFTTRDGLKADQVTHVAEDADGAIWFAYREPIGLSRLTFTAQGNQVQHFTRKEGLPSDYILAVGLDTRGRLWVTTDYGVAARRENGWQVYSHDDGLVWDDCAASAFWAESDGSVWIGTLKGLSRFRPDGRQMPAVAPTTVITAAKFDDHSVDPAQYARVSYRDHDFLVSFAGLTFLSEKNVRFRYRLVGLDQKWIETASREARYPSLPAGDYRFEVAARNARGLWSTAPATISFHVVPPWWQTWWFRSLAASVLAALLFLGLRSRVKSMVNERRRLHLAVRERTRELEFQKNVVECQKLEIEQLLREAQEVSRLKSEFLANMSHEIRTPMNGVIGMTQLVLNTPLSEEQRDYITTVRDSADALLVVINDILDFSKIEAGKMELAHDPFCVRKCVNDCLQVFAWKAQEKGLRLTQQVSSAVPEAVAGDADRLRQILLNLLGNSMKYTEHGEIALNVELAEPAGPSGQHTIHFSVRDTGTGIAHEKQALIFEAFAQADGSMRRRRGGTGLGLAICNKLVQLMHGRIWVESTPAAGSTFHFTVRLQQVDAGRASSICQGGQMESVEAHPMPAAQPLRVLLAEDNPVNRKLAQRVIEKMGHAITTVENGRQALAAATSHRFDLILMDVQMPEMDGFEACAAIRGAEAHDAHVPIVALTAHAMSGDREQCLRAGMDDYIAKPIDIQALTALVARVRAGVMAHNTPVA